MKNILLLPLFLFIFSCSHISSLGIVPPAKEAKYFHAIWNKNLDPSSETGNLPIGLQSPYIYEGLVFVGPNDGYFHAYELENGKEVWKEFDDSAYHSGAVGYKDQVIYGTVQGRVISRNYLTGKIKYSVDLGASIETIGTIYQGRVLFQLRNHQVFSLDVETGKVLWGYKRSVSSLTTLQKASAPIVFKDKVLVGMADGSLIALSLDEGVLLYEVKLSNASKFVDVDAGPFIFGDKLLIGAVSSPLSVLDPVTGKILRRTDFVTSLTPFLFGDKFILGTTTGDVVLTDKNFNLLSKVHLSDGGITTIVTFKGKIALGTTTGEIHLLNPNNLERFDSFNFGHSYSAIFGSMAVQNDYLVVFSSRNRLFTFH